MKLLGADRIYLLNLRRREDRLLEAKKELRRVGIYPKDYVIYNAFDGKELEIYSNHDKITPGAIGCYLSHLAIWKDAILNNFSRIVVFEDDIIFPGAFRKRYRNSIRDNIDFLFLGWYKNEGCIQSSYTDNLIKAKYIYGTHGYVVNNRKTLLLLEKGVNTLDLQVDGKMELVLENVNTWFCNPPIVNQTGLSTDIQRI